MVDINRGTSGVDLPHEVAQEVWTNTVHASAVMKASRQVPLPGNGQAIDIISGLPTATWVAETGVKPTSVPTLSNKLLEPYMMAVIVPFSNQFKRDKRRLFDQIVVEVPKVLGQLFDTTVYGGTAAPGGNFDQLNSATKVTVDGAGTYGDIVSVYTTAAAHGYRISAWNTSAPLEALIMSATDSNGAYVFIPDGTAGPRIGRIMGADVFSTSGAMPMSTTVPDQTGFAGDFAGASVWGSVEGIRYSETDQATLTASPSPINLWERNMFAIRFEVEVAFRIKDINAFVQIDDGVVDTP